MARLMSKKDSAARVGVDDRAVGFHRQHGVGQQVDDLAGLGEAAVAGQGPRLRDRCRSCREIHRRRHVEEAGQQAPRDPMVVAGRHRGPQHRDFGARRGVRPLAQVLGIGDEVLAGVPVAVRGPRRRRGARRNGRAPPRAGPRGWARARARPRSAAAIAPTSQGRPTAARPIITASAPEASSMARASAARRAVAVDHDGDRRPRA